MAKNKISPRRLKQQQVAKAARKQRLNKLFRYDEVLFSSLIFCFFSLAPLPFISGFTPAGKINFTLYDLPKFGFLCSAALFISFVFVFSLSYHSERRALTKQFLRKNNGLKLLLVFFAFQVLSLRSAIVWQNTLLQLAIYLSFMQLFIVLAILFRQKRLLSASLLGTILSLLFVCPLGFFQFFHVNLPFLLPISGPGSTFGYRNPAAHYLVLNLPFAAYLVYYFWQKKNEKKHPGKRIFMVVLFISIFFLALIHVFMTTTRTAILALLLSLLLLPFYYLLGNRQKLSLKLCLKVVVVTLVATMIVISGLMLFPQSRMRVLQSVKKVGSLSILEARRYHWGNTIHMIKEHPLSGVGLGNWRFAYPQYMHSYARDTCFTFKVQVKKTHNDYLQIAAECGVGALLVFLFLWGRQFYLLWKFGGLYDHALQYPLFCGLLTFSVIMLFSFPLQMGYSCMFFFFLLALVESQKNKSL